mmetsp:Transcript_31152/g.72565  ORF Transcript_31152/g.72565 Transcript_31152/m.72565 type:complete len:214 (+) Transcript_31152:2274-2915(+)
MKGGLYLLQLLAPQDLLPDEGGVVGIRLLKHRLDDASAEIHLALLDGLQHTLTGLPRPHLQVLQRSVEDLHALLQDLQPLLQAGVPLFGVAYVFQESLHLRRNRRLLGSLLLSGSHFYELRVQELDVLAPLLQLLQFRIIDGVVLHLMLDLLLQPLVLIVSQLDVRNHLGADILYPRQVSCCLLISSGHATADGVVILCRKVQGVLRAPLHFR